MTDIACVIGQNIESVMKEHHINVHAMSKKIGVDSASCYKWVKGLCVPKSYHLYLIARLFDVPMERFMKGVKA